jgi:single-stranded-DNA-specific exonuclease
MVAHLLYCRGFGTAEEIQRFFTGGVVHHDPLRLPDMRAAVDRIARAVREREPVAIYGDFDCDGITAAAVLLSTLRALDLEPIVHIPTREDGHGLNPEGLAALADRGATLVVTADCGVTAIEEVQVARGMGMDAIVTDHHLPRVDGSLPDCPVICPTRQDADYPCRFLCGVGVAYKLAEALADRFPGFFDPTDLLDLVALGTVADVVPLRDENRSLVIEGLKRLRATSRPGLLALFSVAGIDRRRIDPTAVGFYLAPRINAANRLASPQLAYELITANDPGRAHELAAQLSSLNQQRQLLVAEHFQQIAAEIGDPVTIAQEVGDDRRPPILIVMGNWPSGISGLLASRLAETYGLPAFAGADAGNGLVAVSARGVPGVQIDELLEGCEAARPGGLFVGYGGHSRAGGFRVAGDRLALARELLEDQARRQIAIDEVGASLTVDAEVSFGRLTVDAALRIRALAPFGGGFPEPLFLARRVVVRRITRMKDKHARLSLQQNGTARDGVCFNSGSALFELAPESMVDVVFHLQLDEWNGMLKPQLCVRDWRTSNTIGA